MPKPARGINLERNPEKQLTFNREFPQGVIASPPSVYQPCSAIDVIYAETALDTVDDFPVSRDKAGMPKRNFDSRRREDEPSVINPTGPAKFGTSLRDSSNRIIPGETGLRDGNAAARARSEREAAKRRQHPTSNEAWRSLFPTTPVPTSQAAGQSSFNGYDMWRYTRAGLTPREWANAMGRPAPQPAQPSGPWWQQYPAMPVGGGAAAMANVAVGATQRAMQAQQPQQANLPWWQQTPAGLQAPVQTASGPRMASFTPTGQQALAMRFGPDWAPKAGETPQQTAARRRGILQGNPATHPVGTVTDSGVRNLGGGMSLAQTTGGTALNLPAAPSAGAGRIAAPLNYTANGGSPVASIRAGSATPQKPWYQQGMPPGMTPQTAKNDVPWWHPSNAPVPVAGAPRPVVNPVGQNQPPGATPVVNSVAQNRAVNPAPPAPVGSPAAFRFGQTVAAPVATAVDATRKAQAVQGLNQSATAQTFQNVLTGVMQGFRSAFNRNPAQPARPPGGAVAASSTDPRRRRPGM